MADCHRCDRCQTWRPTPGRCLQIACLACGMVQCQSNGLARGCCRHCHYGRLPGWSFMGHPSICQFKGCVEPTVYAYLPGSKHDCCLAHGQAILTRQTAKRQERQQERQRRYA